MKKIIQRRPLPNGISVCSDPLLDRLYRSRHIQNAQELDRTLASMLNPNLLSGMESAVNLLTEFQQHKIVIVGDFDADGATSTALTVLALRSLGFADVHFLIPNRFEQGYGLSVAVAEMAVRQGAELVITVDNGVSSHEGVDYLKRHGVKVLITDHHLPPETLPAADAIVNPNLNGCTFPSKSLAGVGVAFYVMLALRTKLREMGQFDSKTQPNFTELLDIVALGTIADVVPLDQNNRILAYQGLARIRAQRCRYGIQALVEVANKDIRQLTAGDLGYSIAPRLNAAGRLDNMSIGVELLLADSMEQARALALELDDLNQTRKEIEQGMKQEALDICRNLTALRQELPLGVVLYQADWHQGVLGILASRIKDQFHRPVIAFAQDSDGVLKGSARSVDGVHMRDLLERVHSRHPDMLLKFGGHAMAAGLSIREPLFERFQQVFNEVVTEWLGDDELKGTLWTDGELTPPQLSIQTAEILRAAGPWGQAFPEPVFDGEFKILQQRLVGERHLKMLVEPAQGGQLLDAIAFNIDTRSYPDLSVHAAKLVYKLDINEFRGNRDVQLLVDYIEPVANEFNGANQAK
ncbi:single-stranded-DNA-specific exonuclease RecJ [Exercitatus varius]|uniref:single-stranded-DNA-specific exonuclease RecJ n=1 Tax=Exercitatus varius TaxID=67857 RepID=UPI00294AEF89|nr:single-stranded-DNA-specific exonuclease RecJ [Exercitatus varius]MDG2957900.1 single-stranded-DNA-specific exonuclease RecJ [Exercitatus varius]